MIDQIAHLIEQAEASADAEYALRRTGRSREDIFRQHFAELIVRECASTAAMFSIENKQIHPDLDPQHMSVAGRMIYHSTCQAVAQEIQQHFGVK